MIMIHDDGEQSRIIIILVRNDAWGGQWLTINIDPAESFSFGGDTIDVIAIQGGFTIMGRDDHTAGQWLVKKI